LKKIGLILLVVITQAAIAQDNRLLFHYSKHKEQIYAVGKVISFRIKGSEEKHTWDITHITDSTIVSGDRSIRPDEISHFYVDRDTRAFFPFRYKYYKLCLYAGAGYFLLDVLNRGEVDRSTLIISGSLLGGAVLARAFIKDYIRLKRPRKLVILR